jgi:hypothetical protein
MKTSLVPSKGAQKTISRTTVVLTKRASLPDSGGFRGCWKWTFQTNASLLASLLRSRKHCHAWQACVFVCVCVCVCVWGVKTKCSNCKSDSAWQCDSGRGRVLKVGVTSPKMRFFCTLFFALFGWLQAKTCLKFPLVDRNHWSPTISSPKSTSIKP